MQSVKEVVPGHSKNEITLVLQYYDYSVEQAIQAYLEGQYWNLKKSKAVKETVN